MACPGSIPGRPLRLTSEPVYPEVRHMSDETNSGSAEAWRRALSAELTLHGETNARLERMRERLEAALARETNLQAERDEFEIAIRSLKIQRDSRELDINGMVEEIDRLKGFVHVQPHQSCEERIVILQNQIVILQNEYHALREDYEAEVEAKTELEGTLQHVAAALAGFDS